MKDKISCARITFDFYVNKALDLIIFRTQLIQTEISSIIYKLYVSIHA